MKLADFKSLLVSMLGVVLVSAFGGPTASSMTIQLDSGGVEFIAPGESWKFFRGTEPPSDPPGAWKETDFNDSHWEIGESGFGYGDGDDETILSDMRDSYVTVYIRKEFSALCVSGDEIVQLVIDYDDGFIAYLNGDEVARKYIADGPVNYETTASSHEAGTPETIVLGTAGDLLNDGNNVLAIEGHNASKGSTDFSLIAALRTATDIFRNGETWIVGTQTLTLRGKTDAPDAVSVAINGIDGDFNPGDGTWEGEVSLESGLNTIIVEALGVDANVVDSGAIEIVYVPPANQIAGELTEDTTWSGAYILEDTIVVPAGIVLNIDPGTVVLMKDAVALNVYGQLLAKGTESEPIRFTHYGDGTTWKQIMFTKAADSRLAHCIVEYADCEGDHKDYYDNDCNEATAPPSRVYFQAVVALASHIDIEGCLFQKLPDDGASPEGDAIAIISDDPDVPGEASANIRDCQFLGIGQGVHTRFSYVLVEDCFFTGHHGDNDDIDLYGESTPPPLVRNNVFLNPAHDDMINPTRCSAVIIGNVIGGCDDHGVVLRDKCSPVMMNNLIFDCRSAGIAVQNQCDALLVNNTIVNCGRGIRFFDHTGRWGPPYCLVPGSGRATVINCIIWDCPTSMLLTDSPYQQDPGSHVTVMYSNIEGGQSSMSVSANSTVTWGAGNIDLDPQFVDPGGGDYHLKSEAGRWDLNNQNWVKDAITSPCVDAGDPTSDWTAELWPHGKRINMGAYGGTAEASMSLSGAGSIADLNHDNSVDHRDVKMLTHKWPHQELLLAEDLDRNGIVDFTDFAIFADSWGNIGRAQAGETIITYVYSPPNGNIAVRIQLPESTRYAEGAPVVVVASTWFVKKYTPRFVGFNLKYDPTEVGAIFVTHLWPGKEDPETGAASEGTYDYGGPKCLAALKDTILFASGLLPDVYGCYLDERMEMNPLTDNVGLYASSHAGVVATNVLAYHGEELSSVKYFVGRENPTRDEMYALEFGHFDDDRNPVFNPYYDPAGYSPKTVSIDYSKLRWIQNEDYPEGMPYFEVQAGQDHILPGTGPDMQGKRFFSRALTRALLDNGVFTLDNWPDDLATPQETENFWPYRITVNNYHYFRQYLPNLKIMLVFARNDHVQAAPDKPHIHQAYDGFRETAGLWVRLNADQVYFLALDETLQEYPENDANTEPADWMNAGQWGYPAGYGSRLYVQTGSLAGIAEMADRVRANDWSANLDEVLYEYAK